MNDLQASLVQAMLVIENMKDRRVQTKGNAGKILEITSKDIVLCDKHGRIEKINRTYWLEVLTRINYQ